MCYIGLMKDAPDQLAQERTAEASLRIGSKYTPTVKQAYDGPVHDVLTGKCRMPVNGRLVPKDRNINAYKNRLIAVQAFWGWEGCVVHGCENAAILHHFVPRRAGGSDEPSNLIPICKYHERPIHIAGSYARAVEDGSNKKLANFEKMLRLGVGASGPFKKKTPDPVPMDPPSTGEYRYGCTDCAFMHTEKPSYCSCCKVSGARMSCIKAASATLRAYSEDPAIVVSKSFGNTWECPGCLSRSSVIEWCVHCGVHYHMIMMGKKKRKKVVHAKPALTTEECHDQFDKYRRDRAKAKGKKDHNYAYGKELATNMAAPFILRLKAGR